MFTIRMVTQLMIVTNELFMSHMKLKMVSDGNHSFTFIKEWLNELGPNKKC